MCINVSESVFEFKRTVISWLERTRLIIKKINLNKSLMPWTTFSDFMPAAAAAAKSLQSCPTLCNPIDSSPPCSPVPGILQAGVLEWGAISFSNAWMWKVKVKSLSRVRPSATPWTAVYQAPPSIGFSRQESWSGVPLPSLIYSWARHISETRWLNFLFVILLWSDVFLASSFS